MKVMIQRDGYQTDKDLCGLNGSFSVLCPMRLSDRVRALNSGEYWVVHSKRYLEPKYSDRGLNEVYPGGRIQSEELWTCLRA